MAKIAGKVNPAGEAMTPETYELTYVKIYANPAEGEASKTYDVTGLVGEIVVNESLFKASLETEITIADGINFFERARLSGNEKVNIVIQRTEPGEVKKKYEIECYIANIQDFSKPRPGVQVYKLVCVSKHAYYNTFKRLNRAFKGGMGSLVNNICQKDLDVTPHKINTDTKGILKGIFPHMKPIDAIVWLTRNSTDNSTPFYFYETLKDGLIFDSQESLYLADTYRKFIQKPFFEEVPGTEENFQAALSKIIKISSEFDMGKYFAINDGGYASSVKALDISTKTYTNTRFEYTDNKMQKMNANKPFAKSISFNDQELTEFADSKIHHVSLNKYAYNTRGDNYHKPIADSLAQKQAYHINLGYMGQDLVIAGDFDISVGAVIELEIYKSSDAAILEENDSRENMIDKLQSGRYLVTEIAHTFMDDKYVLDIGVQKDSSVIDLDRD